MKGKRMTDSTESIRKEMVAEINAQPGSREYLEQKHGQIWNTSELSDDFEVSGFMAPVVVVTRKSDNQKGGLYFQHSPRFYYGFEPHRG
jgi:hypothetical protein